MKSSKRQDKQTSATHKMNHEAVSSALENGSGEASLAPGEEHDPGGEPPSRRISQSLRNWGRRYFRRSWYIIPLFSLTWLVGAFFLCSRLEGPIQLRITEQFSCFSLSADYPFSYVAPEKLQTAREQMLRQLPPVFDLKESKAVKIHQAFREKMQSLLLLPADTASTAELVELKKNFQNENAVNLFLRILQEVLDCGILESAWEATSSFPFLSNDIQEVIIISEEHQILRDYSSLLSLAEARQKLEEDFCSQIGNPRLDLSYFWQAELLEPTLEYNEEKSRKLQEETLANTEVPREQFQEGDVLIGPSASEKAILQAYLTAGKQRNKLGLDVFQVEFRRKNLIRLCLLTLFIGCYVFCLNRIRISPANLGQRLLVSATALILHFVLTFLAFYLYSYNDWPFAYLLCLLPMALIPSLLSNLLGGRIAICTAVIVSTLIPLQISSGELQYQLFHYSLFVTLVGVAFFQYAKQRRDFIIGGFALGFSIMLSQVFFAFEQNTIFSSFPIILPKILLFSYGNGLLIALLCMALLPVFEYCFGLVTLTTLLELNDTNHPLLRRLQEEAPGTFQHSMNVATIAEAAANTIQANALLTRVMALFHDIGKLENPSFFAENQRNEKNPHDHLPALESSRIITAHVRDGMALAQKYNLRRSLRSAIEQHHGNSLLTFFYEKAKNEAKAEHKAVPDEHLFRYPHPPPLQKEIVIVSLADACEAAVRALSGNHSDKRKLLQNVSELLQPKNGNKADQEIRLKEFLLRLEKEKKEGLTAESVARKIIKIIDDKWSDNQFAEADITTSELDAIKKSFLRTFMDMYHFRPEYPEAAEDDKDKKELA